MKLISKIIESIKEEADMEFEEYIERKINSSLATILQDLDINKRVDNAIAERLRPLRSTDNETITTVIKNILADKGTKK